MDDKIIKVKSLISIVFAVMVLAIIGTAISGYIPFAIIGFLVIYYISRIIKIILSSDNPFLMQIRDSFFNQFNFKQGQAFNKTSNIINNNTMLINNPKRLFSYIAISIIIVIILLKSIIIIQAGETGVYQLFGKVRDQELKSGFHFINPLASVVRMSTRTEQYTMSVAQEEGNKQGDDSIDALTNEGLTIKLDITVLYHLIEDQASDIYKNLGENYEEKIIRPEIRSAIRETVAKYDSKAIYSDKRDEITASLKDRLEKALISRGIVSEAILLRNVSLPPNLSTAIQEKLKSEQESQRYNFLIDKEKKEAERKIIESKGQRDAQQIINESLTDKYLNYLYIKELKDRQGTIYVPINPQTGMPVFKGL